MAVCGIAPTLPGAREVGKAAIGGWRTEDYRRLKPNGEMVVNDEQTLTDVRGVLLTFPISRDATSSPPLSP